MTPAPGEKPNNLSPLQFARLMWMMFLGSGCAFIALSHIVRPPQPQANLPQAFVWAIAAVGAVDIVLVASLRRKLLTMAQEQQQRGEAELAKGRWMTAQVYGFAGGMSIVLFGFVLHTMQAQPGWIITVFFIVGLLNLAAYRPQSLENR